MFLILCINLLNHLQSCRVLKEICHLFCAHKIQIFNKIIKIHTTKETSSFRTLGTLGQSKFSL